MLKYLKYFPLKIYLPKPPLMNPPFFLALPPYPLTLSIHIGYPKIPPVKYPATSSEVVPQEDSSETVDVMPLDPFNEEPLAATSEKPKRGSPDEFQCFLIRHLTTNAICHLRGVREHQLIKVWNPLMECQCLQLLPLKVHPNCQLRGLKQQHLKNQTWNLLINFQCSLLYPIR